MPEVAKFVRQSAAKVTPQVLQQVHKQLPMLKVEFTQLDSPKYPHLVDQLEFLANVVEDFADGAADNLPYVTAAAATFALVYAHRKVDLIPDSDPDYGFADDSAVVRAVLIDHERALERYAAHKGINWAKITSKA
ncbi:MAG: hypothetical protein HYY24_25475 [Verrucomicrobia bacterium]|nr:hypothetical protein [Verrucomicrobiota bacterium]